MRGESELVVARDEPDARGKVVEGSGERGLEDRQLVADVSSDDEADVRLRKGGVGRRGR